MFLLLVACGLIYLLLGDHAEALMLLGFVFVVMGITLFQERRTERALETLLSRVNLTGESVPVRKLSWDGVQEMGHPGGDDLSFVYSGTLLVQGHGVAEVRATGANTELGKIGKALQTAEQEDTPLQRETGRLVRNIAIFGVALCILVVVAYGLTRGNWLNGFLAGIALAMALLPEEFPVVLTIFLALGAWRIAQKHVLTRRTPAIETLGSATVLCTDKTGTLTLDKMTIPQLAVEDSFCDLRQPIDDLPEKFHTLVEFSILASQCDPFDPMEKAILQVGDQYLTATERTSVQQTHHCLERHEVFHAPQIAASRAGKNRTLLIDQTSRRLNR